MQDCASASASAPAKQGASCKKLAGTKNKIHIPLGSDSRIWGMISLGLSFAFPFQACLQELLCSSELV